MTSASTIDTYASSFSDNFVKYAYVRKVKDKWKVFSHKGKILGSFDTKEDAVQRLQEIEYFKHHKKKKKKTASKDSPTYSSIMRELNKHADQETIHKFQSVFKKVFDQAYINEEKEPENIALEEAKKVLYKKEASFDELLVKVAANSNELGAPNEVGRYLSDLVRYLLRKISPEKRSKAIETMRKKIWYINEYNVSSKKTPVSAVFGQILTLIKTTLLKKDPAYIREVLNSIVRHL